ncbi:retrotransposon hot spot (RHS) protein, putative [Trypanosoma cruzi marinkellei]|uniref:Retrotransposon hot spot (RHS) protein, putative n=1 Tax=Trypanosoma cruzi marinkellei TaxID=85056 RepID=K2NE92_TRYCR|nr:retrotransposon hot spot (RHS) protein, putative [Trypanosoma cruzi marinkellei]
MPESEEDTDQSVLVCGSAEEEQLPEWTLETEVDDILLVGKAHIINRKMEHYLLRNLGSLQALGGHGGAWMQMLTRDPHGNSGFGRLLEELSGMGGRGSLLETAFLMNDLKKPHFEGVNSLRQWRDFGRKDTVSSLGRAKLNEALSQVLSEEGQGGRHKKKAKKTEGSCESVQNATCDCGVEVSGGEGKGMEGHEGKPRSNGQRRQLA